MNKDCLGYSDFVINRENFSFTKTYKDFIEYSVFKQVKYDDRLLFCSWINEFYLAIEDYEKKLKFIFGNIRESKRVYYLPVYKNESGYKCFNFKYIKNFPKDFCKELKKRGLVFNGNYRLYQYTTIQRLVACCMYNVRGLHIHHLDFNIENNHISNLIPMIPNEHSEYHLIDDERTLKYIDKGCKNLIELKRDYNSKYKDDIKIYIVLYYRCVLGYKIELISKFKGIKPLSVATIKRILKSFTDFKFFYSEIKRILRNVDTF